MTVPGTTRFPIRFDAAYRLLSTAVFLPPSAAFIETDGREVRVRMGWAFRARFPRSAVASAREVESRPWSRGVHGFAGRWLVNGSGRGLVSVHMETWQRGYVLGFPVALSELLVSVDEPAALVKALSG